MSESLTLSLPEHVAAEIAHQAQARSLGLRYEVVERPDLALDLDTLDDLRAAGL
jgi:2-phospho-L-lactate guanylyltransferase (CobY/MobA/RfbA family)